MTQLNKVRDIPKQERLNPQTLRKIIGHLMDRLFDGEKKRTARELCTHRERSGTRQPGSLMTTHTLNKILDDLSPIQYSHLEAFAYKAGVPTYVLLLFSRAYSDQKDMESYKSDHPDDQSSADEARINRQKMIAFSKMIPDLVENNSNKITDIDEWIEAFETSYKELV